MAHAHSTPARHPLSPCLLAPARHPLSRCSLGTAPDTLARHTLGTPSLSTCWLNIHPALIVPPALPASFLIPSFLSPCLCLLPSLPPSTLLPFLTHSFLHLIKGKILRRSAAKLLWPTHVTPPKLWCAGQICHTRNSFIRATCTCTTSLPKFVES